MGYDCYVRGEGVPPCPAPDWTVRDPIGGEEWAAWNERFYFRRTIWAGPRLAEALIQMGMGFDARKYGEIPSWPPPEDYGIAYGDHSLHFDEDGTPLTDPAKYWKAARDVVVDWHGPEIPGIPVHKVSTTNDGWHVTKEEAKSALLIYERAIAAGRKHPEAFLDDFIPFLRTAAEHDGFEVW